MIGSLGRVSTHPPSVPFPLEDSADHRPRPPLRRSVRFTDKISLHFSVLPSLVRRCRRDSKSDFCGETFSIGGVDDGSGRGRYAGEGAARQ